MSFEFHVLKVLSMHKETKGASGTVELVILVVLLSHLTQMENNCKTGGQQMKYSRLATVH